MRTRGSITVRCEGDCERLLNRCAERGIGVWDIARTDEISVCFCLRAEDIYRLKPLCRRCMCRLRVLKKSGAPFYARRFLKRPLPLLLIVLCAAFLWALGGFVWKIEINGCEKTDPAQIEQLLADAGLRQGSPVRSVRAQQIKNKVIAASEDIAYITVNLHGSRAEVWVYERVPKPAMSKTEPCDVISGLTGVIAAVRVRKGTAKVQAGQSIMAGDVIAEGAVTDKDGEVRLYHAEAECDVRTWYTRRCAVSGDFFEYIPTGREKKFISITVFGKNVPLYLVETVGYKWYYKNRKESTLRLGSDSELPLSLVCETYAECDRIRSETDMRGLSESMHADMLESFERTKPEARIISEDFCILPRGDGFEGVLRIECLETTGIETERK